MQALRVFAAQAAIALDRAQAQEDRSELAVLSDRDRIARDLHDLVIQRLFATGLNLQAVLPQLSANPEIVARIQRAVESLDDTIRDIRGTIFELQHDDETSLRGQIRDALAAAAATRGMLPRLILDGPVESAVPQHVRPHLVAVLVEALSNAARHADAEHVDVRIAVETDPVNAVTVEISDDGQGFTATGRRESGLRNMRERAEALHGTLDVTTSPGKGTTIRWRVPITSD